jgi:hypothetical protein
MIIRTAFVDSGMGYRARDTAKIVFNKLSGGYPCPPPPPGLHHEKNYFNIYFIIGLFI